ncbi:MAG: hypothetical protein ACQEXC_16810, partial [Pseudomonadota bacterium]
HAKARTTWSGLFYVACIADRAGKCRGSDVGHETTAGMRRALGFCQLDHSTPQSAQHGLYDRARNSATVPDGREGFNRLDHDKDLWRY